MKTIKATIAEIKEIYGQPSKAKDGIIFLMGNHYTAADIPYGIYPLLPDGITEMDETMSLDFAAIYPYTKTDTQLANLEYELEKLRLTKRLRPFDLEQAKAGKTVVTRDGYKVTILSTTLRGDKPIAAVLHYDDGDCVDSFTENGRHHKHGESYRDLCILEPKITITMTKWYNIYFRISAKCYENSELCDSEGDANVLADLVADGDADDLRLVKRCIPVTFED